MGMVRSHKDGVGEKRWVPKIEDRTLSRWGASDINLSARQVHVDPSPFLVSPCRFIYFGVHPRLLHRLLNDQIGEQFGSRGGLRRWSVCHRGITSIEQR